MNRFEGICWDDEIAQLFVAWKLSFCPLNWFDLVGVAVAWSLNEQVGEGLRFEARNRRVFQTANRILFVSLARLVGGFVGSICWIFFVQRMIDSWRFLRQRGNVFVAADAKLRWFER